jgi:hypothetical protein
MIALCHATDRDAAPPEPSRPLAGDLLDGNPQSELTIGESRILWEFLTSPLQA